MLFIPSKGSRSRSSGRGRRDGGGEAVGGPLTPDHRPEQRRSSQQNRLSQNNSFNLRIQRTPQYSAFMRVRVGRRLSLLVHIFNLFVLIPGVLLTVFAFLSLNASSIPQESPSSDSSLQSAFSLSAATVSPSAPDASAVGGSPAGDSPRQPAGAAPSSPVHMVHLMWVLAARSLHGRLVWLACPGALAFAAAALGFIGVLRYHRSCLTWFLVLVLSVLILEGGAAAYLLSKTQAFTSEFRAQTAVTIRKISIADGGTLPGPPLQQSSDDSPPGGGTGANWPTETQMQTQMAAATGFSARALDALHAGWFGGKRCCGENGSADWLAVPLPGASASSARDRSHCHPRVPASCCVNPPGGSGGDGGGDVAAEGDVDEEVRVRDSAIVHTDGCATAANLWFGRIATTYAVVTAVIAIFQAVELLMVYMLRYQVQVAEAKWVMAREDRKVAQLQGSRRGGGVDAQMLLEMHEREGDERHVCHSVADSDARRGSHANSREHVGRQHSTQTSVRNRESIVVVNHSAGVEEGELKRYSHTNVRSSDVGHNSGTASANSSVRKLGTIEAPSNAVTASGSHGRTSTATPDRLSADASKRTSIYTPTTTTPVAPSPIVDPFKSRRAPARPVSVSVNDAPGNVYRSPANTRQSTPAALSQMTHLPQRGSIAVVSPGSRGRAARVTGTSTTPESHSMTSSVVASPIGLLQQQQSHNNQSSIASAKAEKPESTLPRSEYSTLQLSSCAVSPVADSRDESNVVMQRPVDHLSNETKTIEPRYTIGSPDSSSDQSKPANGRQVSEPTAHNHSSGH